MRVALASSVRTRCRMKAKGTLARRTSRRPYLPLDGQVPGAISWASQRRCDRACLDVVAAKVGWCVAYGQVVGAAGARKTSSATNATHFKVVLGNVEPAIHVICGERSERERRCARCHRREHFCQAAPCAVRSAPSRVLSQACGKENSSHHTHTCGGPLPYPASWWRVKMRGLGREKPPGRARSKGVGHD